MEGVNDQAVASGHIVPVQCANMIERKCNGLGTGKNGDPMYTLEGKGQHAVAYRTSGNWGVMEQGDKTAALNTATDPTQQIIRTDMAVRRILPIEAERLMGFPDGWTQFGEHGEEIADSPRYRMLGNSVVVPVVEWIAGRMLAVNSYMEILKGE